MFVRLFVCLGLGYGKSTQDELEFQIDFFKSTGIMLDPVYVGKMIYALFSLLKGRKPTFEYEKETSGFVDRLKGKKIMIVHTGGQLANFDTQRYVDFFAQRKKIYDCFGEKIDLLKV